MHWLQSDEDGSQGEYVMSVEQLYRKATSHSNAAYSLFQVMFAQMLRCHKLEALEKLPVKPVLDKESFIRPIGLDKITLVQRT